MELWRHNFELNITIKTLSGPGLLNKPWQLQDFDDVAGPAIASKLLDY